MNASACAASLGSTPGRVIGQAEDITLRVLGQRRPGTDAYRREDQPPRPPR